MIEAGCRPRLEARRKFGPQAGQGTLEYILILAVVVLIILGLLYQFSGAFKTYVASYFGDYIACLLEVGDLPGIATECDASMPSLNINNAKPLITSIGSGGSGSSSSSSNSNSSSSSQSNSGSKSNPSASSAGRGGGSGGESISTTGSSSRNGGFGGAGTGRGVSTPVRTAGAGGGGAGGTDDDIVGISPTSTSVGRYNGPNRAREEHLPWGYDGEEADQERKKDRPTVAAMRRELGENNKLRPKSVAESLTRKVASQASDDEADYTFGGIFRILLIILMLLALIIFFGGQILQISKSGEK